MKTPKYTCAQALAKLKLGNDQHAERCKAGAKLSPPWVLEVADEKQRPFAAILSCADSRVIPERIFETKEGELFVVRVAGNIAAPDIIASLEYAVAELYVPVILVMGHESCGAVETAMKFAAERKNLGYNLNDLVSYIIPAVNQPTAKDLPEAVRRNATLAADGLLSRSEILTAIHGRKQLLICSAYYHLTGPNKGKVELIGSCNCP